MAVTTARAIEAGGVRLSHPDKVLYPEQGITKRELAEYYDAVATWMLPHVARPADQPGALSRRRAKKCFFQRHAGSGVPPQLSEVEIAGFDEPPLSLHQGHRRADRAGADGRAGDPSLGRAHRPARSSPIA